MALTWAGVITILFLAAACVRGYRRGLIKELVSLVCVFLSMDAFLLFFVVFKPFWDERDTGKLISGEIDKKGCRQLWAASLLTFFAIWSWQIISDYFPMRIRARALSLSRMTVFSLPFRLAFRASRARVNS